MVDEISVHSTLVVVVVVVLAPLVVDHHLQNSLDHHPFARLVAPVLLFLSVVVVDVSVCVSLLAQVYSARPKNFDLGAS